MEYSHAKEFARQLLAHEGASRRGGCSKKSEAFCVCERLRIPLGRVMGVTGFSSLLSRALVLGCDDIPWLCALTIDADGALAGLEELEAKLESPAVVEGELVLVGHLLGLLVTFIGPALTLRLLHDLWPAWPLDVFENENLL